MDSTSQWFNYLYTERKLSRDIIESAGLSEHNGLLRIPIHDVDGNVLFSKYRRAPWHPDNVPKYQYDKGAHVALYGVDHLGGNVVVCEGELDALALLSCGFNACSSTGGSMSFQKEWAPLFHGRNVMVLFDNDDAGVKGAAKTALILKDVLYKWVPYNFGKDVSDVLMNDGPEMVKELMVRTDNTLEIHVPDLTKRKDMIAFRMELKDMRRNYSTGSVANHFISALILEVTLLINTRTIKRRAVLEGTDEVVRARSYPIENLIKVNRNGFALCVAHDEKTPSLKVYKDNHAYCFGGCNKRFDSIAVAMIVHNLQFLEAVEFLNKKI